MIFPRILLLSLVAFPAAVAAFAIESPIAGQPRKPAPVSVSSVNYANSSREELYSLENEKLKANPATPKLSPLPVVQRYVFMPGELYVTDVTYEALCKQLAESLAQKGFINAVDEQGRVIDPKNVDLILRVNGGERPWLNPTVRMNNITWRDKLVPRPRGRSLTTLGGDVAWDSRSGGNDEALGAAAENENAPGFGFGSSPASPAGASPLNSGGAVAQSQAMAAEGEYASTRDYYLIVIDAFKYNDLMEKGQSAKRQWTTFVAAPRQHGQNFSDVVATMLRIATPYFGENTAGLQMYNDARATVKIGEMQILESDVKIDGKK